MVVDLSDVKLGVFGGGVGEGRERRTSKTVEKASVKRFEHGFRERQNPLYRDRPGPLST